MKYQYAKVTFQEIPDEITLCIAISGCKVQIDLLIVIKVLLVYVLWEKGKNYLCYGIILR